MIREGIFVVVIAGDVPCLWFSEFDFEEAADPNENGECEQEWNIFKFKNVSSEWLLKCERTQWPVTVDFD